MPRTANCPNGRSGESMPDDMDLDDDTLEQIAEDERAAFDFYGLPYPEDDPCLSAS